MHFTDKEVIESNYLEVLVYNDETEPMIEWILSCKYLNLYIATNFLSCDKYVLQTLFENKKRDAYYILKVRFSDLYDERSFEVLSLDEISEKRYSKISVDAQFDNFLEIVVENHKIEYSETDGPNEPSQEPECELEFTNIQSIRNLSAWNVLRFIHAFSYAMDAVKCKIPCERIFKIILNWHDFDERDFNVISKKDVTDSNNEFYFIH
jgi:hypothetical protein